MKKYQIGLAGAAFTGFYYELEYDGVPPCLYCGEPVESPSMDGPLVCGPCDCGNNRDGTDWTFRENQERHKHFKHVLETHGKLIKLGEKL